MAAMNRFTAESACGSICRRQSLGTDGERLTDERMGIMKSMVEFAWLPPPPFHSRRSATERKVV